jgi:hypothetical protein
MIILIVTTKNKTELQFVSDILKKMRIATKILTDEEQEEIGLIRLMKQTDRTKTVSRSKIISKTGQAMRAGIGRGSIVELVPDPWEIGRK